MLYIPYMTRTTNTGVSRQFSNLCEFNLKKKNNYQKNFVTKHNQLNIKQLNMP